MSRMIDGIINAQTAAADLIGTKIWRLTAVELREDGTYLIRPIPREIKRVCVDKDGIIISTGSEDFCLVSGELLSLVNAIAGRPVRAILDAGELLAEAEEIKNAILTHYVRVRKVEISAECYKKGNAV